MGFDLYGISPSGKDNPKGILMDEKGGYFRNSVWNWRPLWDLVCNTSMDILTPEDCLRGTYNDFHTIDKSKALRIAARLDKHLKSGFIKKYIEDRDKELSNDGVNSGYELVVENVERFAEFCKFSGGFKIG